MGFPAWDNSGSAANGPCQWPADIQWHELQRQPRCRDSTPNILADPNTSQVQRPLQFSINRPFGRQSKWLDRLAWRLVLGSSTG